MREERPSPRPSADGGGEGVRLRWNCPPREDYHLSSFGAQPFQKRDTHSLGTRKNPVGTLTWLVGSLTLFIGTLTFTVGSLTFALGTRTCVLG